MTIKIITPPTHEPITLLEAREHLRVEDLQENAVVHSAVKDARDVNTSYFFKPITHAIMTIYELKPAQI